MILWRELRTGIVQSATGEALQRSRISGTTPSVTTFGISA